MFRDLRALLKMFSGPVMLVDLFSCQRKMLKMAGNFLSLEISLLSLRARQCRQARQRYQAVILSAFCVLKDIALEESFLLLSNFCLGMWLIAQYSSGHRGPAGPSFCLEKLHAL